MEPETQVVAASPTTKGPDRVYQQLAAPQGGSASLSEKCRSDEEIPPSTGPDDIQCQCKPGTFKDANSPEMCQTCSRGCPVGKVVARPCTPWNDIVCVDQESGTQALGETTVPGEPVTTTQKLLKSPYPSTGSSLLPPVSIVALFLFTCLVCFIC
ncbi:tumor necrosis factor receptor superfamily member 10B-like isoform 2-T2 [Molossus nigricans]